MAIIYTKFSLGVYTNFYLSVYTSFYSGENHKGQSVDSLKERRDILMVTGLFSHRNNNNNNLS